MMGNHEMMGEALRRKKAKGLDVAIIVGHGTGPEKGDAEGSSLGQEDEAQEDRELGLAPEATPVGLDRDKKDVADAEEGHHENFMPGSEVMADGDEDKMAEHGEGESGEKPFAAPGAMSKHLVKPLGKGSMAHKVMMKDAGAKDGEAKMENAKERGAIFEKMKGRGNY